MEAIREFFDGLSVTQQKWLLAGGILIGSFVAAWVTNRVISGFVLRWTGRTKSTVDDEIISALHRPVTKSVVLVGLGYMTKVLSLSEGATHFIMPALWTLGVLLWAVFAFRLSRILLQAASRERTRYHLIRARSYPLFDNLGKLVIVAAVSYALIRIWNVDATGWIASAGILGLAIGFAAKDTLSNLFAGVFILADAPYTVGDYIVLSTGQRGKVVDIGIRSTRILTRDDVEITIPNAVMGTGMIVNETSSRSTATPTRLKVSVGVAYGSDVDQVREILLKVAEQEEDTCGTPEPRVRFRAFGESALEFQLHCWIPDPSLMGRTLDALNTAVYREFTAVGLEIPFPKRDLYIRREIEVGNDDSA